MSSVGYLLMVECDKLYIYHMYVYQLIWDNERGFVWRTIGEDLLLECIQQTVKFGGGSVMVLGCISCEGTGLITKMEGRMNGKDYSRLLSRHLLPYMQSSYVFMDDNAPCHQSQAAIWWILKCFIVRMSLFPYGL